MSRKEQFKNLIKDYLSKVNEVLQILKEEAKLNPRMGDDYRLGGLPTRGDIKDKDIKLFSFHGIGCYVEYKNVVIDFNMDVATGKDQPIRGFNPFFVSQYAESIGLKHFDNWDFFEKVMNEMIKGEDVFGPYSVNEYSGLCYLKEDYEYLLEHKPWEKTLEDDDTEPTDPLGFY